MNEAYLWPIFIGIFVVAMVFDLFIFQRKAHIIPLKESLKLVGFWVALALAFNAVIYIYLGHEKGILFTTSYLVEYSLSVDNLFVFLAIFTYFAVPREAQRKVLLWGILGAIFFRGIFIFAGITLIERFHFLIYILGAFLIYTAIKLMTQKEIEVEPEKNPIVRFARKIIRVAPEYEGAKFFKRTNGLLYATPLIIVLIAIETMDIMFATDSVPAVLAITPTLSSFTPLTYSLFWGYAPFSLPWPGFSTSSVTFPPVSAPSLPLSASRCYSAMSSRYRC